MPFDFRGTAKLFPACDVGLSVFDYLVSVTHDIEGVGGYKIPGRSGREGWEKWVETARKYTAKPLLYDHQKAGTDVPHIAKDFMRDVKEAGFDGIFIYPRSAGRTQYVWTEEALHNGLCAIVGGRMTRETDLDEKDIDNIYIMARDQGVTHFGVSAVHPTYISHCKKLLLDVDPVFFVIGIGRQGGSLSRVKKHVPRNWHVVIGRDLFESADPRAAAERLVSRLYV